jgi:hypothetical protein
LFAQVLNAKVVVMDVAIGRVIKGRARSAD